MIASKCYSMESIYLGDSSAVIVAQYALILAFRWPAFEGFCSLIFLSTNPNEISMEFKSGKFAGQSSYCYSMAVKTAIGSFGFVGRCYMLLENKSIFSKNLVGSQNH